MGDSKDITNGTSQARVVLAKPRLGVGSTFGASSSSTDKNPFAPVLRPPQLKPTANPFLKAANESTEENDKDSSKEEKKEDIPQFVPLGSVNTTTRNSNSVAVAPQPATGNVSFVFGQNLSDRVVMAENANNGATDAAEHPNTNGSDLFFTNAAANVKENNSKDSEDEAASANEGLASAAAEYERSHARQMPLTSNCTTTGEEDEINILQISCRLFAWELGSWRERGRGVLRVNDACDGSGSRMVARVAGSLRVVLNTKLWPEMIAEKAGNKSLRVTAADAQQQIKLFLVMGAPTDISQLYKILHSRISTSKKSNTYKQNDASHAAAERLDNSFDEKSVSDSNKLQERCDIIDDVSNADQEDTNEGSLPNTIDNSIKGDNSDVSDNKNNEDTLEKSLKRKEPIDDGDTSPKRQCPKIVVE